MKGFDIYLSSLSPGVGTGEVAYVGSMQIGRL